MTSEVLSDEKPNLFLNVPPTVNIEIVEDDSNEEQSQFSKELDEDETRYELNQNPRTRKTSILSTG